MSADTLALFAPGTLVCLGPEPGTPGVVLAVTVRGTARAVSYDVAWWDGDVRRNEWLQDHEVRPTSSEEPVGFALTLREA